MAVLYDGNGKVIGKTSALDVTDYSIFTNDDGESQRQATLTYNGKKLYPNNYPSQRLDFVKNYGGGVMFALGDSYTEYLKTFFDAFAAAHGLVQDNRGLASSTIAGSADKTTVGYHAFWVRLNEAVTEYTEGFAVDGKSYGLEDVKLVTFMGGANDWYTVNDEIDRIGSGPDETDKEKLYGACNYIFDTLLSSFPNADIVVILQPSSASKGNYQMHLKEGVVREMANMYGLPICDCCFEWYNPVNPTDAATYWNTDELHMTDAGNHAIIDKLEKTVNNLTFTRN